VARCTVAQVERFVTQQIAERAELQKQKVEAVAEAVVRSPLCMDGAPCSCCGMINPHSTYQLAP